MIVRSQDELEGTLQNTNHIMQWSRVIFSQLNLNSNLCKLEELGTAVVGRMKDRLKDNFMRVVICKMIDVVGCKCIKGIRVIEVYR